MEWLAARETVRRMLEDATKDILRNSEEVLEAYQYEKRPRLAGRRDRRDYVSEQD
jgi:hypothetical protein